MTACTRLRARQPPQLSIGHTPHRAINIGIQAKARKRHATVFHFHTLGFQQTGLLAKPSATRRHRNVPTGAQHAKPGEYHAIRYLAQQASNQACAAR